MWIVAIALLAQSFGVPGYVLDANGPDAVLVTHDGVWEVAFGPGCEFLTGNVNVEIGYGSSDPDGNVGAVLIADDQRCSARQGNLLDPTPCAVNANDICDVAALEVDQ